MKLGSLIVEELHEAQDPDLVVEGWSWVADQEDSHGRWRVWRTLVLKDIKGQFWGVNYAKGLTEYQDPTIPWRDSDEVTLERLYPHYVTTIEYRSKP